MVQHKCGTVPSADINGPRELIIFKSRFQGGLFQHRHLAAALQTVKPLN
nr:MAG TPA: hypothetical protein [Bacteriophage sp.]